MLWDNKGWELKMEMSSSSSTTCLGSVVFLSFFLSCWGGKEEDGLLGLGGGLITT